MSSLKERLETHPIKNLNAVIRSVKSEIAPKLALSKDKKRHSKAKLIEHILLLDKMGLLKQDVPVYKSPAPKAKAPKPASAQEIKDSLMVPGKYTKKEIKEGKALVKNQPKKAPKAKAPKAKAPKKQLSLDCGNALQQAQKVIKFYTENKGVFSKNKFLIKNNADLKEKMEIIGKFLNDPKCKDAKTTTPFIPTLEKALSLYLDKDQPKKEDQPKTGFRKKTKEEPKPKKEKKPRAPSAWNKYVKKMGGVKKASADKAGFEAFKKSL